jgi:hypothetical protein
MNNVMFTETEEKIKNAINVLLAPLGNKTL